MPSQTPIPPDDAAKFATDIVSRLPQAQYMTAADRDQLTGDLSRFLSRCVLVHPPSPFKDQDDQSAT